MPTFSKVVGVGHSHRESFWQMGAELDMEEPGDLPKKEKASPLCPLASDNAATCRTDATCHLKACRSRYR